jgi:hypothetical protein
VAGCGRQRVTSTEHVTERIRRPNYGTLLIDLSVDDPKAYTKLWTVTLKLEAVDTELIEAVCAETEKDVQHLKQFHNSRISDMHRICTALTVIIAIATVALGSSASSSRLQPAGFNLRA